jgi:hypothetical protein
MRTIPRWNAELRRREGERRLQPAAPVRTIEECARELGMTVKQVYHAHTSAIQKIRAALSAYGYGRTKR